MNPTQLTSLERRVLGTNGIAEISILALEKVYPQLQKLVGKKVRLADGSNAKCLSKIELLDIPFDKELGRSYRKRLGTNYHSLYLWNDITIKDREYEGGGYGVSYYDKRVTIGRIENGILVALDSMEDIKVYNGLNKRYDAKQIQANLDEIERLENQIRELKKDVI